MDEMVRTLTLAQDVVYVSLQMDGRIIREFKHTEIGQAGFDLLTKQFFYLGAEADIVYDQKIIGKVQIIISLKGLLGEFAINLAALIGLMIVLIRLISYHSVQVSKNFIFEPIQLLEQKASRIAAGELDTVLEIHSKDEIGRLSAALDSMRLSIIKLFDELKSSHRQLENYNLLLEEKVKQRTAQLHENNIRLDQSLRRQEQLNKDIVDSIEYAKRIQNALLPPAHEIQKYLPQSFVHLHQRDIVGGDLYFFYKQRDQLVFILLDCTGHGVPGAFMTMIASTALQAIFAGGQKIDSPARVLMQLNQMVKTALSQEYERPADVGNLRHSDDGMDAAICLLEPSSQQLSYAGARIPLFYCRDGEVKQLPAERMSLGYQKTPFHHVFHDHHLPAHNTSFYLFTDGVFDQKGGSRGLPLGKRRLMKMIASCSNLPMQQQKQFMLQFISTYRGDFVQQDDYTIAGIRL